MSRACIACGINARLTIQRFDFKPCIIGKAVQAEVFLDIACLLKSIPLQRIGCFRNIHIASYVLQRQQFIPFRQHCCHLF